MQPFQIKPNYQSSGVPELDSGNLLAQVTRCTKSTEVSVQDGRQVLRTVLKLKASVTAPQSIEGRDLFIHIAPATDTSYVHIPEKDATGVGTLYGTKIDGRMDSLELDAVLLPPIAKEVFDLVMQQPSPEAPLTLTCDVLGLGKNCVWDPLGAPILVRSLNFYQSHSSAADD